MASTDAAPPPPPALPPAPPASTSPSPTPPTTAVAPADDPRRRALRPYRRSPTPSPRTSAPPSPAAKPADAKPAAASPPQEDRIQRLLATKRAELDAVVAAFRAEKDAELAEYERELRASAAAGLELEPQRENEADKSEVHKEVEGAPKPLDLGGSLLDDRVRLSVEGSGARTSEHGLRVDGNRDASPSPDDRETQTVGLFTPSYLPLLDHRRYERTQIDDSPAERETSPLPSGMSSPPTQDPSIPTSRGNSSTHLPLASSLKSSSSGDSMSRKIRSPKKVTFAFEDESSVPSRSSPPPTKVTWTFGGEDDDDFDDLDDIEDIEDDVAGQEEYVEDPEEDDSDDEAGVRQVEDVAASEPTPKIGSWRDSLVVPMMSPTTGVSGSRGSPGSDTGGGGDAGQEQPQTRQSPTSPFTQLDGAALPPPSGSDADEDDDALFDLDEQIPDELPRTPPHRDFSPEPVAVDDLTAPAASLPMAASFMRSPVSPTFPARSTLSGSFSRPIPAAGGIASSLPTWNTHAFSLPSPGPDAGRFRRRSVTKYIPSPPSEEEEPSTTTTSVASPQRAQPQQPAFGSSLPISIAPRPPPPPPADDDGSSPLSRTATALLSEPQPPELSARPSPTLAPDAKPLDPVPEAELDPTTETEFFPSSPPASTSPPRNELDAFTRSNRFTSAPHVVAPPLMPSSNVGTPYRTRFAQELAAEIEREGGASESIVGGVDGRTGMDPGIGSWNGGVVGTGSVGGFGSIGQTMSKGARGSLGGLGSFGAGSAAGNEVPMSMSMRLAMEEGAMAGRR